MVKFEKPSFDTAAFLMSAGLGRRIVQLMPKQPFFTQGDPADSVFYLQKGQAKITVVSEAGKEATIAILSAGEFVGEGALAGVPGLRLSTATAITACTALKISREEMIRVMHEEHEFSDLFLKFLLIRSMRIQADLVDQLFNSSEKRLARILLLMAEFGKPGHPQSLIPKISQQTLAEMVISAEDVRRGLENDEFAPFFQPLVTLRTGHLAGFEVLARWYYPSAGILPPDRFIPVAEQSGWIGALTKRLMQKAFEAAKIIPEPLTLAFNVSPLQLHDLGLPKQIQSAAEDLDFPLRRVVIEITESALVDNVEPAQTISNELKALGCKIGLDDFGTGYSSLLHLQSLPFDELKVDRSFVSSMTIERESRKIVAAVVGLGQSLGLSTAAEGIETEEQADMLLRLGCDMGQGWHYGRPAPAEVLPSVIELRTRSAITCAGHE